MLKFYWLFGLVFLLSNADSTPQRVYKNTDICGYHNGHRRYLELGETGQLTARNVTVSNSIMDINQKYNKSLSMSCSLELVTCPSCSIKVTFSYTNYPKTCQFQKNGSNFCPCDHLILGEPPYDENPSNLMYHCGSQNTYRSKTRSMIIKFVFWNNNSDAFSLQYTSERNREVITSSPGDVLDLNGSHNRIISSPYFPAYYPRDYSVEHVLRCNVEACRIHVLFTDFHLSSASNFEFFDTTGERLFVKGTIFRPPVLISSGSSVMIRFHANGSTDIGYKAKVTFLTTTAAMSNDLSPITNCGGMVQSVGGAITMMNMLDIKNATSSEIYFDCIWIVRPPQGYLHLKSHLSLKVESFENMAAKSELIIIQGITSDGPVIEAIESSPVHSVASRSLVVPLVSGFYVRLRAKFNTDSRLAIVYSSFSYTNCYVGSEFLCQNKRCISLILHCDGFNQCGDDSDEPESCSVEWENDLVDRRWYSHTPNYYFPKNERFSELKTTTLAFVVSSISLMFVISCLILTLYRNGNRVRQQQDLQNQLQTISQLLDGSNNNHREEIIEPPPTYEAPPNYDEIIKIGIENEIIKNNRDRRSARKINSRLNRHRRSDPSVSYQSNLLEGVHSDGLPSPSSSIGQYLKPTDIQSLEYYPSLHMLDVPIKHLWNEQSKMQKSWIMFNSEECLATTTSESQKRNTNQTPICTSTNYNQLPEDQTYLQFNPSKTPTNANKKSYFFSAKFRSSILATKMECSTCHHLILNRSEIVRRYSLCGECVEKLYSPKICASCDGRISFKDFNDDKGRDRRASITLHSKVLVKNTTLKLCNCFPKYPSQNFSAIQPNTPKEIQILQKVLEKSYSFDQLMINNQKIRIKLASFHSHSCLPLKSFSSTEEYLSSSDSD
ncbi:unnamed protein product [Diamesa serratosioi]